MSVCVCLTGKLMKHDFEELGKHAVFIIKPPNAACGNGIKIVTK